MGVAEGAGVLVGKGTVGLEVGVEVGELVWVGDGVGVAEGAGVEDAEGLGVDVSTSAVFVVRAAGAG